MRLKLTGVRFGAVPRRGGNAGICCPGSPKRRRCGWFLCLALASALDASARADSSEVRYVQVQSLLGQMYDAVIDVDDAETFGRGIPRGSALPRRLYPVSHLGTPMMHRLDQPLFQDVLLRYPNRNHTEYLALSSQDAQNESLPSLTVTLTTNGIVLSWPSTTTGWTLETTSALGADGTGSWELVPPTLYQSTPTVVSYLAPIPRSGEKFFRLRGP